ncbi:hypothetical protein O9G_004126 [Rozella allomycis CSF55]|uniref:Calponin-homology (CH) domain-containing protein n=1 Tax=Rozella allomycis (strain CSF55) TaxID=988480 RepID=A0A075AV08_ROZAC|nr:hypothetical protein O9G_004126 [Rozella allomycis CSF55]|eukprot:EPZ32552.1 hypothetical protein O9G_004126 [Rozella allomycis CSF55]
MPASEPDDSMQVMLVEWINQEIANDYKSSTRLEYLRPIFKTIYEKERGVLENLKREIDQGRLSFKKGLDFSSDIGLRVKIIEFMMNVEGLWLAMACEVIGGKRYDERAIENMQGVNNLLSGVLFHYGQTSLDILFNMLAILYIVDVFKRDRKSKPTLFRKNAYFKSVNEMIIFLGPMYMHGEGDLRRHLLHIGMEFKYSQTFIDEYEMKINNLAVDLKDGIRLVKLISLFLKKPELINKEMDKVKDVKPKDIVMGHKEKTLSLLWRMFYEYKFPVLVNKNELITEVNRIRRNFSKEEIPENKVGLFFQSEELSLLFEWVKIICEKSGITIHNFTNKNKIKYLCLERKRQILGQQPTNNAFVNGGYFAEFSPNCDSIILNTINKLQEEMNEKVVISLISFLFNFLVRQTNAAIVIQNAWRKHSNLKLENKIEKCFNELKSLIKMNLLKCKMKNELKLEKEKIERIISIQILIRKKLMTEKRKSEINKINAIKSLIKMKLIKQKKMNLLSFICTTQSLIKKSIQLEKKKKQIKTINEFKSLIKRFIIVKSQRNTLQSIVSIQCLIKRNLQQRNNHNLKNKIISFQSQIKRVLIKSKISLFVNAINDLQGPIKMRLATQRFTDSKNRIIQIQSLIRKNIHLNEKNIHLENELKKKKVSTIIQSFVRRSIALHKTKSLKNNLINLQSLLKRNIRFLVLNETRNEKRLIHLQSLIKRKLLIHKHKLFFESLTTIQCLIKRNLSVKLGQRKVESILTIQAFVRRINVQILIKNQTLISKQKSLDENEAALKIQRLWKGFQVRKSLSSKHENIKNNIIKLSKDSNEEMKLCNRTQKALDLLSSSPSLSVVLQSCFHLEAATLWSFDCALKLLNANVVLKLYNLIQSCNRSPPHQEIMSHCFKVMLNISNHPILLSQLCSQIASLSPLIDICQNNKDNLNLLENALLLLFSIYKFYPKESQILSLKLTRIKSFIEKAMKNAKKSEFARFIALFLGKLPFFHLKEIG